MSKLMWHIIVYSPGKHILPIKIDLQTFKPLLELTSLKFISSDGFLDKKKLSNLELDCRLLNNWL